MESKILEFWNTSECFEQLEKLYIENFNNLQECFYTHLITLHNEGKIDILQKYSGWEKNVQSSYSTKQILAEILPELKSSLNDILLTVSHFKGESDFAGSYEVEQSLIKWVVLNKKSSEFIDQIKSSSFHAINLANCALESLKQASWKDSFTEALNFAGNDDFLLWSQTINFLGHLGYEGKAKYLDKVISLFANILDSIFNDEKKLCVLTWAISGLVQYKRVEVEKILQNIAQSGFPKVQGKLSLVFSYHYKNLDSTTEDILLKSFAQNTIEQEYIFKNLDTWANKEIDNNRDGVFDFWNNWLTQAKNKGDIRVFDVTLNKIVHKKRAEFEYLITSWFSSDNQWLHCAAGDLLDVSLDDNDSVEFDLTLLNSLNTKEIFFMVRKLLGHQFFHPKMLCSLIYSLTKVRHSKKVIRAGVVEFFSLLMGRNFYKGTTEFLDKKLSGKSIKTWEQKLIHEIKSNIKQYYDQFKSLPMFNEFKISAKQEIIKNNLMILESKKMNEEVDKHSILTRLVTKQLILYGRTTTCEIHSKEGSRISSPLPMNPVTHSMEIPRMLIIDPIGFEYKLFCYQIEEKPKE